MRTLVFAAMCAFALSSAFAADVVVNEGGWNRARERTKIALIADACPMLVFVLSAK